MHSYTRYNNLKKYNINIMREDIDMILIDLIFGFFSEHLIYNKIKLSNKIFILSICIFVIAFVYCWLNGL